jgi:hypothetical protein
MAVAQGRVHASSDPTPPLVKDIQVGTGTRLQPGDIDGTAEGTRRKHTVSGSRLIFVAGEGAHGREL